MESKISLVRDEFLAELEKASNSADLEAIRIKYLGKKGPVTELMKGMKDLSNEEKKTFGQKVNELKAELTDKLAEKTAFLKEQEILKEIEATPDFDISMPATLGEGSYHPVTLVQRQCEQIFKSMGFAVVSSLVGVDSLATEAPTSFLKTSIIFGYYPKNSS